jgi:hypothetical protein
VAHCVGIGRKSIALLLIPSLVLSAQGQALSELYNKNVCSTEQKTFCVHYKVESVFVVRITGNRKNTVLINHYTNLVI